MQRTKPLNQFYMSSLVTKFGCLRPISDGNNLIRLDWNQIGWQEPDRPDCVSRETISQLQAFFIGRLYKFTLPLAPIKKTDSGKNWLNAMSKIPYGTTVTYAEFAAMAGKPAAARAAGHACATNPIPIIYPCHRVVRSDGTLGNFSVGTDFQPTHRSSLALKAALIRLETKQTDYLLSTDCLHFTS